MRRRNPIYTIGILLLAVVLFVGAIFIFLGFGGPWRKEQEKSFWENLLKDFDWNKFPWDTFPFEKYDDFPWSSLPWETFPEDFDWSKIPWDDLPEDYPWNKLPWENAPDDLPWSDIPWGDAPENFPWSDVPWEKAPTEMWEQFPWTDLPENFPWAILPWLLIPPSYVPEEAFPDGFYPEAWVHEHVYASEEWDIVEPATCGKAGIKQNLCIICNRYIRETIPATNKHTFGDDGICPVCGMRRLILLSESKKAQYSGEPLVGDGPLTFMIGSATLLEGHSINYAGIRFAQCKKLGRTANSFYFAGNVVVIDENGNDVTSLYAVFSSYGVLELTKREIVLRTKDKQKPYDGTPLMGDEGKEDDYTVEGLVGDDHLVDVVFGGTGQIERGRQTNEITSFRIVNGAGEDVSANYSVTTEFGTLSVI